MSISPFGFGSGINPNNLNNTQNNTKRVNPLAFEFEWGIDTMKKNALPSKGVANLSFLKKFLSGNKNEL